MVESHAPHPVVAESALRTVLSHVDNLYLARFYIIYIDTLAINRDVEVALAVIGKAVDASTGKVELLLIVAGVGIVAVECISATHPVVSLLVFVDDAGACRRKWVCDNLTRMVETVYATILHRAPGLALIARSYRRYATADDVFLCRETPSVKGLLSLIDEVIDESRTQVEIAIGAFQLFHLAASFLDDEYTMFRSTEIEVSFAVEGGIVDSGICSVGTKIVACVSYLGSGIVIV